METLSTQAISLADVNNIVHIQRGLSDTQVCDIRETTLVDMKHVYLNGKIYTTTDWAMAQLLNKLGIPYTYLKKCFSLDQRLGRSNYSIMGEKYAKPISFKIYNGEVIGALSPTYTEFANEKITDIITNIDKIQDMDIRNHRISPHRLHLRMTEKKPLFDDLYCGVQIDNSEIGKTALSFRFFVYKQLCTNGMGFTKLESNIFAKKHVGITLDDTKSIEEGLSYLKDYSDMAKRLIENSMEDTLTDKEMDTIFHSLIARHLISKKALEEISVDYFIKRYGKTRWAVANIITELSHKFTLDTRLALENYAGQLLA